MDDNSKESESEYEEFCDAKESHFEGDSSSENHDETGPSSTKDTAEVDAEADRKAKEALFSEEELQEKKTKSLELKEQGNTNFKQGNNSEAIAKYTQALEICPLIFEKDRSVLFSNRAACNHVLKHNELALADCDEALKLQPTYMRCLYRRAELRETAERLSDALEDYQEILKLDPSSAKARWACTTLPDRIKKQQEEMKEKMMGQLKDLGNMVLKPFGLSTNNFKMQKNPESEGYSINFVR